MGVEDYYLRKLCVITGGSEGIGRAVARSFARAGAHVVICSRSDEKLRRAVEMLMACRRHEGQHLGSVSVDVTDHQAVERALSGIVEDQGVPYFLVNCAGFAHPGYIQDLTVDAYRRMVEVNYLGVVNTTKALIPYFLKRRAGHIVNVSSIAGFIGLFGYTGYCASKYAVIGFSEALRRELRPYGVRVSVLCPPNTRTSGLEKENRLKPAEVLATEGKVKVVDPEDVARALLRALPRNRFMIIPSLDGKVAYYLSRYLPGLLDVFVKRPAVP